MKRISGLVLASLLVACSSNEAAPSEVQTRITGECAQGTFMVAALSDGGVKCAAEPSYTAGAGLSQSGSTFSVDTGAVQARITGSCAAGTHVDGVNLDGTVSCGPDLDTTYSAGAGLALALNRFSIDTAIVQARVTGSCAAGTHVTGVNGDGSVTCVADLGYTAGSGLSLSGSTLSADTAVVQARVSGTCPAGQAIQSIDSAGAVTCGGLTHTVVVHPVGTATENGNALLAAMAGISGASQTQFYLLKLEPGIYDLGTQTLRLKAYVDVEGSGDGVTEVKGTGAAAGTNQGTVTAGALASRVELRALSIESTVAGLTNSVATAVYSNGATLQLSHVSLLADGGSGSGSLARTLVGANGAALTVNDSTVTATGGDPANARPAVALASSSTVGALVYVHRSELQGYGASGLAFDIEGSSSRLFVSGAMIVGGQTPAGVFAGSAIACVGAYSGTYSALSSSCQ